MALYHLRELRNLFDNDLPCAAPYWPVRATLALWCEMVHAGYQGLRILRAERQRELLEPCTCALCITPPKGLFTPEYFWGIWATAKLPQCHCPVCRQQPTQLPHGFAARHVACQTPHTIRSDATTQTITARRPPPLQAMIVPIMQQQLLRPPRPVIPHVPLVIPPGFGRPTGHGRLPDVSGPSMGPNPAAVPVAANGPQIQEPARYGIELLPGPGLRATLRRAPRQPHDSSSSNNSAVDDDEQ